jgi:hypothetical protein
VRRAWAAAVVIVPLLAACADKAMPGEELGTYKVVATKKVDTCGPGVGAIDPWIFTIQLSRQVSTLYWSTMDGSPLLSGPLDSRSEATLTTTVTANVDGTDAALGPCTMQRSDQIVVALGSGVPPGSFAATLTYTIAPVTGSTCDDQLTTSGGSYAALPCTLSYDATASRQ